MRKGWLARLVATVVAIAVALAGGATVAARASSLAVDSSAFIEGGEIPPLDGAPNLGCMRGRNISPPLRITGVPANARSLAVVLYDDDARFVHWVAYGIDPRTPSLPTGFGTRPGAYVGGVNDAGAATYTGPCPPPGGPHHYTFSVYATTLERTALAPGLSRAALLRALAGHELAVATLTGTFQR